MPGVTIATILLRNTQNFLTYHYICFPIRKFKKFLKVKSDLKYEISTQKYTRMPKLQLNQLRSLGVTSV